MAKNSKTTVNRGATYSESDCPVCGKHYEGKFRTVIKVITLHMKANHPDDKLVDGINHLVGEDRPSKGMPTDRLIR